MMLLPRAGSSAVFYPLYEYINALDLLAARRILLAAAFESTFLTRLYHAQAETFTIADPRTLLSTRAAALALSSRMSNLVNQSDRESGGGGGAGAGGKARDSRDSAGRSTAGQVILTSSSVRFEITTSSKAEVSLSRVVLFALREAFWLNTSPLGVRSLFSPRFSDRPPGNLRSRTRAQRSGSHPLPPAPASAAHRSQF